MPRSKQIVVKQSPIAIIEINDQDYISLTDMVRSFGGENVVYNWMRNRNTVEFIGIWEQIHNPGFKRTGFDTFKIQAGLNNFTLTPRKWIENTGAIGFISKAGRYGGGTYAHKDIAFEFGSWLSAEFKLISGTKQPSNNWWFWPTWKASTPFSCDRKSPNPTG